MVVELRKRKAAPTQPEPVSKKAATAKPAKTTKTTKEDAKPKKAAEDVKSKSATSSAKVKVPQVGDVISLEGFGGELQTQDGASTNLKSLIESSKAGVVLFTYPRASTPGCKFLAFHQIFTAHLLACV